MRSTVLNQFLAVHGRPAEFLARAPGRIEVIGNHTDYNGGRVLGAAIDRGVWVALARRTDGRRRFASDQRPGVIDLPAGSPEPQSGAAAWTNYPLGLLASLPSFGARVPAGFDYLAVSDVPPGAGLSSSAALELASGLVFLAAAGDDLPREALVRAARQAENEFVGVPCGILDQGVSGFGRPDHLVFIDCRGPRFAALPLPAGVHFWVFNTHTRHALVDGLYAARHRECQEAAAALGVSQLVDVSPDRLSGADLPRSAVALRRARHVVGEIGRVDAAVAALTTGDLAALGRLLTASHHSSRDLFENSTPELDLLVDELVTRPAVRGARLTGGGFGGAVVALTTDAFTAADAAGVQDAYERIHGVRPEVLHVRAGDGAALLPLA